MLQLIDTHAHLADSAFDADLDEVLKRARETGVKVVIGVGETLADAEKLVQLSAEHPEILPAAGLYPTYLDVAEAQRMVDFIRAHRDRLTAIGEVGLDYWKVQDNDQRMVQKELFVMFIDLAKELDLPLNVHSRSAGRHVIALLLEKGAKRVHLHAFDAKPASAAPAVEAGYLFSVPPSIVRSRQKQRLVKQLPLDALMLETDSPVLGPDPSARNEPANIVVACKAVAELKGLSEQEVSEATFENTRRMYGIE